MGRSLLGGLNRTTSDKTRKRVDVEEAFAQPDAAPAAQPPAAEQPRAGASIVDLEVLERDKDGRVKRVLIVPKPVKLPTRRR
jgi:hypothetical protein